MPRVTVGRIRGHRGASGAMTVDIHPDDAELWLELDEVAIGDRNYPVRSSRAYADKLVLELEGIDDASAAVEFKGRTVEVDRDDLELDEGEWLHEDLIGLKVLEGEEPLGRVRAVVPTAGNELLELDDGLLIPLVEPIVESIDLEGGTIHVALPDGLRELNR